MTQSLYLVFGGELIDTQGTDFRDPQALHVVGIFADYDSAEAAWRSEAQRTVDSAQTRYFIVSLGDLNAQPTSAVAKTGA